MRHFFKDLARVVLPLVVLIFLVIVGVGYFSTLSSLLPGLFPALNFALAIVATFLVFLMILHTGKAFAELDRKRWQTIAAAVFSFVLLFAFSGWGVVTAAMFLIEGPTIVREKADEISIGMSRLDQTAKSRLPVPEYEKLISSVRDLESKLVDEINNKSGGRYCGIGPQALSILAGINAFLPSVTLIAGTDKVKDCRDIARLRVVEGQYRQSIANALANHPMIAANRVGDRIDLQNQITSDVVRFDQPLKNLAASSLEFRSNPRQYTNAFQLLSQANSTYSEKISRLNTLLGEDVALPKQFDLTEVESISTGASVINAVIRRLDRTNTWIYLLGALLMDLAISIVVATIISDQRKRTEERERAEARAAIPNEDVRFLWMPPSERWLPETNSKQVRAR